MNIQLPIYINDHYFNECWSFEYFCIIDCNVENRKWKYQKYNFVTNNEDNEIIYGVNGKIYDGHNYFDSILNSEIYDYNDIKPSEIINFIKDKLFDSKYVIIMLFNHNNQSYHEYLLYGYNDEKKVFLYPYLSESSIVLSEIAFDDLVEMYNFTIMNLKKIYSDYFYKLDYFFPITILTSLSGHKQKSSLNEFYLFLSKTLNYCWESGKVYFYDEYKFSYFNGLLGVINVILIELDEYRYKNKRNYDFCKNLKSYIFYRYLFFDAINFYIKDLELNLDKYSYIEYGFKLLENVLLILMKKREYSNELIEQLRNKIIDVFQKDFSYIHDTVEKIKELLINK